MRTVINKTRRPIRISLPRGKTLFLGPGGRGQVHEDALERPSFKKLIEVGDIEVIGAGGPSAAGEQSSIAIRESRDGHPQPKVAKRRGNR